MIIYINYALIILFITSLFALIFAYIGFPVLLWRLGFSRKDKLPNRDKYDLWPNLQIIIAVYNDGDLIAGCIDNIFQQNYHDGKLSILMVSDGSTDDSNNIVKKIAEKNKMVELFCLDSNYGKNNALNSAFEAGLFKSDLLCFTDADTVFEPGALAAAVGFFSSPQVGLVGGNISYWLGPGSANRAEGFFWRLENFLREAEGDLGCLVSCPGQCIMMRRELFQPLPAAANTDFALPLSVLAQGYETRFAREARVRSLFPAGQADILTRRKRTIIRALTTMAIYRPRLPWRIRQVLFWHKSVRFYGFPLQLLLLAANGLGLTVSSAPVWKLFLVLQLIFYGLAALGWLYACLQLKAPLVHLPYQFTMQNAVAFTAVIAFLKGQRVSTWVPPR
jgi:cellulose synthase/poly-beta-1,6-N-acetylglucosamine synthase-like glycosyltransferase